MCEPSILFLDEPTSGLGKRNVRRTGGGVRVCMCDYLPLVQRACMGANFVMRIVGSNSHCSPFKFRFRRRRSGDVRDSESCREWNRCDLHHSSAEHAHFRARLTFAPVEARVCIVRLFHRKHGGGECVMELQLSHQKKHAQTRAFLHLHIRAPYCRFFHLACSRDGTH